MWCSSYLQGFDEYMNLVLDDAEEILVKKNTRKHLGMLMAEKEKKRKRKDRKRVEVRVKERGEERKCTT